MRKITITFILGFLFNVEVFSQIDQCEIYERILKILNAEIEETKYYYTIPEDTVFVIDMEKGFQLAEKKVKGTLKWKFIILNKNLTHITSNSIQSIKRDIEIENKILDLKYEVIKTDTKINCIFSNEINYQYIDSYPDKSKLKDFIVIQGQDTIEYWSMFLIFSNILYAKEGYALVVVFKKDKTYNGRLDEWAHIFIFEQRENDWELKYEKEIKN